MAHLFELSAAYLELQNMADNPDIPEEELSRALVECSGALSDKAIGIAQLIKNLTTTAEAIKEAEIAMAARRKHIESRVDSIKKYLLQGMQRAELFKIECPYFKISRKKNPQAVVIDDEKKVDIRYWRQPEPPPPALDKKAMKDDMENGVIIDGAHLGQGERIEIK